MQFNENIAELQQFKTKIIKILDIFLIKSRKKYKKEYAIVIIKTKDYELFSNFYNIWKDQMIDIEDLEPGMSLEITYNETQKDGKHYKNFWKIEKVNENSEEDEEKPDQILEFYDIKTGKSVPIDKFVSKF